MTNDADIDNLLESYNYNLPAELIASRPASSRDKSRLLVYNQRSGNVSHDTFSNISQYLPSNSCLVFNESKVFPCRLRAKKETGGNVEVFILSLKLGSFEDLPCMLKSSGKKKIGEILYFDAGYSAEIIAKNEAEGLFRLRFSTRNISQMVDDIGQVPIPPYIRGGESDARDLSDYQTIYAKNTGSVAAPTAGLHFTDQVFSQLAANKIETAFVNLHVGLGTFSPVRTKNIHQHKMHAEQFFVDAANLAKIEMAPHKICVGTTSLRVVESILRSDINHCIKANQIYETDLFLHPGKSRPAIKGLITNFHLPKSTLLMLVSNLIGRKKTLELYQLAIEERYRFFSYGDAMCILF